MYREPSKLLAESSDEMQVKKAAEEKENHP